MPDLVRYAYQPDMIVESLGHATPEDLIAACGLLEDPLSMI